MHMECQKLKGNCFFPTLFHIVKTQIYETIFFQPHIRNKSETPRVHHTEMLKHGVTLPKTFPVTIPVADCHVVRIVNMSTR